MALSPPEDRLWWKEPLHRMEIVWISIAFLWGLVMFFTMIYWHMTGKQNLSNEAYRVDPAAYGERVEAFAEQYKVREEGDTGIPVVRPPAGGGFGQAVAFPQPRDADPGRRRGVGPKAPGR